MIYTARYVTRFAGFMAVITNESKDNNPMLCLVDKNNKPIAEILTPGIKPGQQFHEKEVNFLTLD